METAAAFTSITATTRSENEFRRLIDWCYDVGKVGWAVAGCSEDGDCVVRLTLSEGDSRLDDFAAQVEGRVDWTVDQWP